jgi:sugar phosphate isomerase/epimerase
VNTDNIRKYLAFLKETKWDGVVSLECYGADDNIRKSVEFLRALTRPRRKQPAGNCEG